MSYNSDQYIRGLSEASSLSANDKLVIDQRAATGEPDAMAVSLSQLATFFKGAISLDIDGALVECVGATSENLDCTYDNGALTLTANTNGELSFSDFDPVVGVRILVWQQTSAIENGIYEVTDMGGVSDPYILTRTSDADTFAEIAQKAVTVLTGNYAAFTFWFSVSSGWVIGTNPVTISVLIVGATAHNNLQGLNLGDYRHLTASQLTGLTGGTSQNADSFHTHLGFLKTSKDLTVGYRVKDLGAVANTFERYIKIELPVDQSSGTKLTGQSLVYVTIYGNPTGSPSAQIVPMQLLISVDRGSSTVANAKVKASAMGAVAVSDVKLYNSGDIDYIYIDMNTYPYHAAFVSEFIYFGSGTPYEGTVTGSSTLTGTLVDSYTITATGGGDGTWGSITGILSTQTDLQSALDAKLNASAKAAGSDIATGTDDEKFATAKALKDSGKVWISENAFLQYDEVEGCINIEFL